MDARYLQACNLLNQEEFGKAEKIIDECLKRNPNYFQVLNVKAVLAARLNRHAEAEQIWLKLSKIKPNEANTYSNLGNLYRTLERYPEAEQALAKVLALKPNHADANMNMGVVCYELKKFDMALAYYDRALAANPNLAQAQFNKGRLLEAQLDFKGALDNYRKTLVIDPCHYGANANLIMVQHYWTQFEPGRVYDDAIRFGQSMRQSKKPFEHSQRLKDPDKALKVGWVSGDFRNHPVSHFLMPILPFLDQGQFALYAYSNSNTEDEYTAQLRPYFKQWHVVDTISDAQLAQDIYDEGIDLLIDLAGHTAHNRVKAFVHKPAPVQVTWLGYFGTTGLSEMDYILADVVCVPESEEHWYSECVWRLPHSRHFLFKPDKVVENSPLPCLQEGRPFTFGCFQKTEKINVEVLKLWSSILQQTPNARLKLQSLKFNHEEHRERFLNECRLVGIDTGQVTLTGMLPRDDYFRGYTEIDIALDTFPFTGGTTTVDALWSGVPTLTLARPGMLGRQGEQLLKAANLPEWVCESPADYMQKAVYYANGDSQVKQRLAQLRKTLPLNLPARPSANPKRFADDLMLALRGMWKDSLKSSG